mgnify:CR=1 FL=1
MWKQYSKVKVSGRIGETALGTASGYLTSKMNDVTGALDIKLSVADTTAFSVGNNIDNAD